MAQRRTGPATTWIASSEEIADSTGGLSALGPELRATTIETDEGVVVVPVVSASGAAGDADSAHVVGYEQVVESLRRIQ